MENYDVIICGGAVTGCTLALALASALQGKVRIAIVERTPLKQHQGMGFDARSIALSVGSLQQLARIRLANGQNLLQVLSPYLCEIKQIHVSDANHSGLALLRAEEMHLAQLGGVVELAMMGKVLMECLVDWVNINYFCPARVVNIQQETDKVQVELDSGKTLVGKLLVGADGTTSLVAKQCQIAVEQRQDFHQTAMIATVKTQQPHCNVAYERFTEQGPLALLPMQQNRLSLVWCVSSAQAQKAQQWDNEQFLRHLQQKFGWRLGKFQVCGTRHSYPLALYAASQSVAKRTVLIGNAAQTLHPIAGQGFNLGMRDISVLTQHLLRAFQQDFDLGDQAVLCQYNTVRQADREQLMCLTRHWVTIFTQSFLPIQIGRNLGLTALAQSRRLRKLFAQPLLGWQDFT